MRSHDPSDIDIDALVAAHPEWGEYEAIVRERFGPLADAVVPHAGQMYPTRDEVRGRLEYVVANWADLMADVGVTLRDPDDLRAELESAQCPTWFPELDVHRERALQSLLWSKDIRARYTILHLASELGLLEQFAADYIERSFANA